MSFAFTHFFSEVGKLTSSELEPITHLSCVSVKFALDWLLERYANISGVSSMQVTWVFPMCFG